MRRAFFLVALSSVVAIVYLNSFPAQFHYDDYALMLESPRVTSPAFEYASFLQHYGGRPLTLWTFYLNNQLFGEDASAFHAVNLILHIVAACLLLLLVCQITGRRDLGFLSAFIFALHPVQTQAVNYIWSRSVLLMAVFVLLSGLLLRKHPVIALLCLQLAIWSRAEAIVLIPPLLVLKREYWKPLVGVGVVNVVLFLLALNRHDPSQFAWNHSSMTDFWQSQMIAVWKYLQMMTWPTSFSIDYELATPSFGTALVAAVAVLTLTGALGWLFIRSETARVPAGGLLLSLLALTPSLLVPNTDLFNESRSYMAFAFFSIAFGWALLKLVEQLPEKLLRIRRWQLTGSERWRRDPTVVPATLTNRRPWLGRLSPPVTKSNRGHDNRATPTGALYRRPARALLASCALVAVLFIPTTLERNQIWRSDVALWREAVVRFPNKGRIRYNLGVALARTGERQEALKEFQIAVSLMPGDDLSYAAIGYCAELAGDWSNARRNYQNALSLNPENDYAAAGLRRVTTPPRGQEL